MSEPAGDEPASAGVGQVGQLVLWLPGRLAPHDTALSAGLRDASYVVAATKPRADIAEQIDRLSPALLRGASGRTRIERALVGEHATYAIHDVEIHVTGGQLWFQRDRGGGCPLRASYVVLARRGDPLEVTVCYDPEADKCEAVLHERVALDLTDTLASAHAATVQVVQRR